MEMKFSIDLGQILVSVISGLSLVLIMLFRDDMKDLKKRIVRVENIFMKKGASDEN